MSLHFKRLKWTRACWFWFRFCICIFFLTGASFIVIWLVCLCSGLLWVLLSVPVQLIESPSKYPIKCHVGCYTLLTHSLSDDIAFICDSFGLLLSAPRSAVKVLWNKVLSNVVAAIYYPCISHFVSVASQNYRIRRGLLVRSRPIFCRPTRMPLNGVRCLRIRPTADHASCSWQISSNDIWIWITPSGRWQCMQLDGDFSGYISREIKWSIPPFVI